MSNISGQRVRLLRNTKEWTIDDLAYKLNTNRSTISKIERGQTALKGDVLIDLSKLFNVSTDYILGLTDIPSNDELKKIVSSVMANASDSTDSQIADIIIAKLEERGILPEGQDIPEDKVESIKKLIDAIIDLAYLDL
ncbi:helix-turn-helix domain-containing protein [Fusibacter sp. JL216-2]|uniref:helix-turn-helix domain-containing protein n=1 Tax=Fusibacter sp. JL216-2 TaxID=3071453 RepID=UPI003D337D54